MQTKVFLASTYYIQTLMICHEYHIPDDETDVMMYHKNVPSSKTYMSVKQLLL